MKKIAALLAQHDAARGQSLVETAIIAPLLVFFMLGIFEVGWALRNYFVLVNVNREITRFAVRPGYMNFSTVGDVDSSFQSVRDWALSSVSEQLNLDFEDTGSTTLIVSHAVVDTGIACADPDDCNCENLGGGGSPLFLQDDLILHPGLPGYSYQSSQRPDSDPLNPLGFYNLPGFGPEETATGVRESRINFDNLVADLTTKNNKFNCELFKKGGVPSSNNLIVTELYHDQPQLFGFPLISNPYTDPVPLYTHTTMRLVSAARSTGGVEGAITEGIDTIGPVCLVYPMLIDNSDISATPTNIIQYGWLKWNPSSPMGDEEYLGYALEFPQMSLNDFVPPGGVQQGSTLSKVTLTDPSLDDQANALIGRKIIIPYSNDAAAGSPGVDGFVWVTVQSFNLSDVGADNIIAVVDTLGTELPAACQ